MDMEHRWGGKPVAPEKTGETEEQRARHKPEQLELYDDREDKQPRRARRMS